MSHLVLVACFTFESLTADIFVAEEDEDDKDELDHDDIAEADEHEQEVRATAGQEVGAGARRLEPRSEDLAVEADLESSMLLKLLPFFAFGRWAPYLSLASYSLYIQILNWPSRK